MRFTRWVLLTIIGLSAGYTEARDGLYIRFSLGTGLYTEQSILHESGLMTPAKNHAVGWGFMDKFALQISDFGGLIKNDTGNYHYINLDALGPGLVYFMPCNTCLSVSGGLGTVSFAKKWSEATGEAKENGIALNVSLGREWTLSKRWGLGVCAQGFYFKTKDIEYEFTHLGVNGTVTYYFKSVGS